jgi:hypothetical protein
VRTRGLRGDLNASAVGCCVSWTGFDGEWLSLQRSFIEHDLVTVARAGSRTRRVRCRPSAPFSQSGLDRLTGRDTELHSSLLRKDRRRRSHAPASPGGLQRIMTLRPNGTAWIQNPPTESPLAREVVRGVTP